ncbi:hypothetical protein BDW71DRAFT_35532 [Aspergillus fruticulosus]
MITCSSFLPSLSALIPISSSTGTAATGMMNQRHISFLHRSPSDRGRNWACEPPQAYLICLNTFPTHKEAKITCYSLGFGRISELAIAPAWLLPFPGGRFTIYGVITVLTQGKSPVLTRHLLHRQFWIRKVIGMRANNKHKSLSGHSPAHLRSTSYICYSSLTK